MFCIMDVQYGDADRPGPFVKLINSRSVIKMFVWGIIEQATGFSLIYILPLLLALKFRTARNCATMGGTIIGVLTMMSYMV